MAGWLPRKRVIVFGVLLAAAALAGGLVSADRATRRTYHEWHENVGWAIIILAAGHAFAALYHHYALKDRVLIRMMPRGASHRRAR